MLNVPRNRQRTGTPGAPATEVTGPAGAFTRLLGSRSPHFFFLVPPFMSYNPREYGKSQDRYQVNGYEESRWIHVTSGPRRDREEELQSERRSNHEPK